MASSDLKINYSIRPSKAIERRMLLEVIKEICTPTNIDEYEYIGFGSSFFVDFKLFHRALGIRNMLSIEASEKGIKRCNFNKPFNCIKILEGHSSTVLPGLKWKKKSIVWLDYDKGIQNFVFDDIETCFSNLKENSFFVVSLRRDFNVSSADELREKVGDNCSSAVKNEDLLPPNASKTLHKMLSDKIKEVLVNRSSVLTGENKIEFVQLFNFSYNDNANMYTLGGILLKRSDLVAFRLLKLNTYHFINSTAIPFNISTPVVTQKEFLGLNELLPVENKEEFMSKAKKYDFLDTPILESFFNTYRFYLPFVEVAEM
jgi:hypothetical protein